MTADGFVKDMRTRYADSELFYVWTQGSNSVKEILQQRYVTVRQIQMQCIQRRNCNVHRRNQSYALPVKGSEVWKEWISDRGATKCYEAVMVEPPIRIRVAKYVPDTTGVTSEDTPLCLIGLSIEFIALRSRGVNIWHEDRVATETNTHSADNGTSFRDTAC